MCGSPKIPAQDPRFAEASVREIQLAERMYEDYIAEGGERDWMKNLGEEAIGISRRSAQSAQDMSDYQLGQMKRSDQRYWDTTVPLEDELLNDVREMNSEEYRDKQVGIARADVQQSFDSARAQGMRAMSRMGIDPNSGAYAKAMADGGRAQALAAVTASNKTREAAKMAGLSSKFQVYGGMKGMAGMGATSAQLAMGAQGAGQAAAAGITGAGGQVLNQNNAAFGAYAGGVNGAVNGYNGYYGNSVKAAEVKAANDPGNMILGAVTSIGAKYAMGKF